MKKQPLTWEEHEAMGEDLKEMRDRLLVYAVAISNRAGMKWGQHADRAWKAIDKLRCEMDNLVTRQFPEKDARALDRVYYPKGWEDDPA